MSSINTVTNFLFYFKIRNRAKKLRYSDLHIMILKVPDHGIDSTVEQRAVKKALTI